MTELLPYNQWVLWRYELTPEGKPTKEPYSVHTGRHAATDDPNTWASYSAVLAAYNAGGYSGIGFVLSQHDPFAFIDFDDAYKDVPRDNSALMARAEANAKRQIAIAAAFPSYSERSPSGSGLHILVMGSVPTGRRRESIEVYSHGRYMTVTGDVYNALPITNQQQLLMQLWTELEGKANSITPVHISESAEIHTDDQIYEMGINAENGALFTKLWNGDMSDYANDWSRADFALINILGFYSRNIEQITRMFRASELGKRDKAGRTKYVRDMVIRSFDNQPPDLNLDVLKASIDESIKERKTIRRGGDRKLPTMTYVFPPGLMGDIASYIYSASIRPVPEMALTAAIGFMAGICGRAFNVSGTGLNQYVILLGKTGTGKEAMGSGIDRIMAEVVKTCPAAVDFMGPSEVASGQALIKHLATRSSCMVSVLGEFGLMLAEMCDPRASSSEKSKRRILLKIYNKSGRKDVMRDAIYSDKANNIPTIHSPSYSLIGESTPESYYRHLDEFVIEQGLLPRFTVIDYTGGRVESNENHNIIDPSPMLTRAVSQLCTNALTLMQAQSVIDVGFTDDARAFLRRFDKQTDNYINGSDTEAQRQLWNRSHLKIMKLAALVAVGIHPYQPIADINCVEWAHRIVVHDVESVLARFDTGKVGNDSTELNQVNELADMIGDYLHKPFANFQRYHVEPKMHEDRVFPSSYMLLRLQQRSAFRKDSRGPSNALRRAVDTLIAEGSIREMRPGDVNARYGKTAKCFAVVDYARFDQ